MSEQCVLYRHFNKGGALLYVGITNNPSARWSQHRDKTWWPEVASSAYEHFKSRHDLQQAEREAIRREQPLWNQVRYRTAEVDATDRRFLGWLRRQSGRSDQIGDLARDVIADPNLRWRRMSSGELYDHLLCLTDWAPPLAALRLAAGEWVEWVQATKEDE